MTSTPSITEPEEPAFPTEWHLIDVLLNVECRQLSEDTYELKWPGYTQTINQEGFNLYRNGTEITPGYTVFDAWCEEHYNHPMPRPFSDG